jgi:hypothetical protein
VTDIARPPIVADALAHRSVDIHWSDGLSPSAADLFAHHAITISAPPPRVWHHLLRAQCWPGGTRTRRAVVMNRPRAYHAWLLAALDGGTQVLMEEIGLGDTAKNLVAASPGPAHRGHDLWNVSLKFLCEAEHVSPHRADAHCDREQIAR